MVLTDNELGRIEQLTYLTPEVAEEAGIEGFEGFTSAKEGRDISTILGSFNENALRELERKGDQDIGFVSAKEWAGMIRYLQSSRMKDLVLTDTMTREDGTTLALCFTEDDNSADAVVAFKGTSGGDEWADNVQGLNQSDTLCQKEPLDFIESLSAENITVTGHSKGGNKAMYVAITSDKVTRRVAYDGQGFSQEFIDKYWAEIQAKGGNKIVAGYAAGMNELLNGTQFNNAFNGLSTARSTITAKIQELIQELYTCEGRIEYRNGRKLYWQEQLRLALAKEVG